MVLDALGINGGDPRVDSQSEQEGIDDLVAAFASVGQASPLLREFDGLVGLRAYQFVTLKALNRPDDGNMSDPEMIGQIPHAALAVGVDQVCDGLDIVLSGLGAVGAPDLRKAAALLGGSVIGGAF